MGAKETYDGLLGPVVWDFYHVVRTLAPFLGELNEAHARKPLGQVLQRREEVYNECSWYGSLVKVLVGSFDQVDERVVAFQLHLISISNAKNDSTSEPRECCELNAGKLSGITYLRMCPIKSVESFTTLLKNNFV